MFDAEYFNLGYLDTLSYRDTVIHRLDPRTKIIATGLFIMTVVSFPKYEITGLLPFFIFPVILTALADIPAGLIARKVIFVSPFALFIGLFNPLLDRQTLYLVSGIQFAGGCVSFLSIMLKFALTVSAALLLIATTSFPGICHALRKMGMPEVFVIQLLFLYRYIFVLSEVTMKVARAREMRSFGGRGRGIPVFISIIGTLFLRTVEQAERTYKAMLSRGFNGTIHSVRRHRFRTADAVFICLVLASLYVFRTHDITGVIGSVAMRTF